MNHRIRRRRTTTLLAVAAMLWLGASVPTYAQGGRGGGRGGPPPTAKAAAPEDITGYWVSIVTEDWLYRMVTPAKGDYASVPLNQAGRQVADTWDPAKDEAAGNQCKSYGAAFIMRVPGRLHITWADDNTLKIETDAGEQTRLFHFGPPRPPTGEAGWQGYSEATWEDAGGRGRGRGGLGGGGGRGGGGGLGAPGAQTGQPPAPPSGGSLKVVTTHMRPGYLRKNGVPYSANTVLTEYYDRTIETNGDSWLIITTIVDDPMYLTQPFITSTHFKKLPDSGPGWHPTPCTAK